MHVTGTHHIALLTDQFDQMRDFYRDILGFPEVGAFQGKRIIFLEAGTTSIELVEIPHSDEKTDPERRGWTHFALEVPDCDAAYQELLAQGVDFHVTPKSFPEDNPAVRIAFFGDPDGNELELVEPIGGRYPQGDGIASE